MQFVILVVSHEVNKKMEKQQRLSYTIKTAMIFLDRYDTVSFSLLFPACYLSQTQISIADCTIVWIPLRSYMIAF